MTVGRRILIVRLSALGDIVHAVPVLNALRRQDPQVEVDWLVEERYADVLGLVDGLRRRVLVRAAARGGSADTVRFPGGAGYLSAVRYLRQQRYDAALDLQGLIKSAVWARMSGARRVIGFAPPHLRERQARWLYGETVVPPAPAHVIRKNLAMAAHLGADADAIDLRLHAEAEPDVRAAVAAAAGGEWYAVLNPGAAWPNKRWPPERFGALASVLFRRHGLVSLVTWGPSERDLADTIVRASEGAARLAPPTSVADLAALMAGAALVVSGDTGPLHIAAAMGAPIVGLFGPTWPERNGPWAPDDVVISRADVCQCHHKRQCLVGQPCVDGITLDEVVTAVEQRLMREPRA